MDLDLFHTIGVLFRNSEEPRHEGSNRSLNSKIQGNNRVRRLETLCQVHKSHSAMLGTFASRVKRDG